MQQLKIFWTLPFIAEWDNFVLTSVQTWENFYLEWLKKENNILLIFYEALKNGSLHSYLSDVSKFLGITYSEQRMRCVLKYNDGRNIFRRLQNCHKNDLLGNEHEVKKLQNVIQHSSINQSKCTGQKCHVSNESLTLYIYTKKHFRWINSAIRNVKRAIKERDIVWPSVIQYEDTPVRISVCSNNR